MAEYKQSNGETASWRLTQLYIVDWMVPATWVTVVILELIHTSKPDFAEGKDFFVWILELRELTSIGHGRNLKAWPPMTAQESRVHPIV